MAIIDHIDGPTRRVYLHADTVGGTVHPIDIYKEMRTLRANDDSLKSYTVFLEAYGNVPKGGGKSTERYVQCINGTRIVPYDATQLLTISGTIITDDGQEGIACFDRDTLIPTTRVDIAYVPPQVEVIEVNTGSGITEQDKLDISDKVWDEQMSPHLLEGSYGKEVRNLSFVEHWIYVDTEQVSSGTGTQYDPFNSIVNALDYAELYFIKKFFIYSDIVLDRTLKNYEFTGIGNPTIDVGSQSLTRVKFSGCALDGPYTGDVYAESCSLEDGFYLNGDFKECVLNGDLICLDNSSVKMIRCASSMPGLDRPTISMGSSGNCGVSAKGQMGDLTIKDCTDPGDIITVGMSEGSLAFDSSNTGGEMVARGVCKFVDETPSGVSNVTNETIDPRTIERLRKEVTNWRKHDKNTNTVTLYDDDKIGIVQVFDAPDDLSELNPQ